MSSSPTTPTPTSQPPTEPSPLLLPADALPRTLQDARRPSVQFKGHVRTDLPTGQPKMSKPKGQRKLSPPPPPLFQPRVSFDTFEKKADFIDTLSFSLIKKHKDYEYTKRSRTFLCGLDSNDYSEYALEWLLEELVDDGDEVVCLRVVEKDSTIASFTSVQEKKYRDEADTLMSQIEEKNKDKKAINLVLEFAVGKVQQVIDNMIKLYEPAILIVGTRGRDLQGFKGLLPGSVSKYCLQMSPVPVIVVRPSNKRAKERKKREGDPSRQAYRDLLEKSGPGGGHLLDTTHIKQHVDVSHPASEAESAAVAAAIGYKDAVAPHPLSKVESADTAATESLRESSPEDMRSPTRVMKSPELQNLPSPELSDADDDDDDEDAGVSTSEPSSPEQPRKIRDSKILTEKKLAEKKDGDGPDFDINALIKAAGKK